MKTQSIPLSLRQGDVLLLDASYAGGMPASAAPHEATGNKVILAYGETTGHTHRFEFMDTSHNAKLYVAGDGNRYLEVTAPAGLRHEEHDEVPAPMTVGKWVLPVQIEYTPAELRRVED